MSTLVERLRKIAAQAYMARGNRETLLEAIAVLSAPRDVHVGQGAIVFFKGRRILGTVADYDERTETITVATPWGDPVFDRRSVELLPIERAR